jgi:integrase
MMTKRGNGEGSIYPIRDKDGKVKGYRAAYVVHTAEGMKRRYLSGKRRENVRDKLAKALADRTDGLVFDAGTLTVGQYLERWHKAVKGTVRDSTYDRMDQLVRLHIRPALGRVRLKNLTTAHARWLYRERLDSGLAPATVHKIHAVLHKALEAAVADGLLPRNPTAGLKLPKITRQEIHPLSTEETRRLLGAAIGDRLEALYVLAIATGLRQGELLALKWEDVDLERGVLRVRRTITRKGGKLSLGEPKTKKSRRSVKLTVAAMEALRSHLPRQLREMERMSSLYRPGGLVFANEVGSIINPSNLRNRSFAGLLKRADLSPTTRFHDLRHTCATLLLSQDINPKIVSEMLGHSSVAITLDIYSHVLPTMQENAIRALENALKD